MPSSPGSTAVTPGTRPSSRTTWPALAAPAPRQRSRRASATTAKSTGASPPSFASRPGSAPSTSSPRARRRRSSSACAEPRKPGVRVVDHREIFAGHEQHLPTFNSRAIITALWRIQGLAEHYIYFNDDFVLLQRLAPEDFFRDGRVVARGAWHPQTRHRPARRLLTALRRRLPNDPALARAGDLAAQELSARLAGFDQRFLRMEHNPFPQRRQTLERFFQQHPDLLEHNLAFRLRSSQQFKTEVLATHLELANGSALLDKRLRTLQLKPAEQWLPRLQAKVARADRDPRYAFACVQSLDLAPPRARACITEWLQQRVGSLVEAARAGGP